MMIQTLLLAVVLQEAVPPSIQDISPARIQANVDHLAQDELHLAQEERHLSQE